MSFNINQFYDAVKTGGGLARKNKYVVTIVPPGVVNYSPAALKNAKDLCQAVNLPGKSLSTFEYGVGSSLVSKYSQGISYDTFSASFWLTNNMVSYEMFSDWIEKSYSSKKYVTKFKDTISGTVVVQGYNESDEAVLYRKFFEAHPIALSGLGYSSEETNSVQTFDVTFTYKYWTSDENDTGSTEYVGGPF